MIYIAFGVCMGLLLLLFYDSVSGGVQKAQKRETDGQGSAVSDKGAKTELEYFLDKHQKAEDFQTPKKLENKNNGYYYEDGKYSVTVFEYGTYRTAQLFQNNPYSQLADLKGNIEDSRSWEINYRHLPEHLQSRVQHFFTIIPGLQIQTASLPNEHTEDILSRIRTRIQLIEQERIYLTTEQKQLLRNMQMYEIPELMQTLYSAREEKVIVSEQKIGQVLFTMERKLMDEWEQVLRKKKLMGKQLDETQKELYRNTV